MSAAFVAVPAQSAGPVEAPGRLIGRIAAPPEAPWPVIRVVDLTVLPGEMLAVMGRPGLASLPS